MREAVQLVIQVLESPEACQVKDPLPRCLAEVGIGARYLVKGFDLMEDHLPETGVADHAELLAGILEPNLLELSHDRARL